MYLLLRADQRLKQNHKDVEPAGSSTRTIPIGERIWTDIEPQDNSLSDYPVSKKLINLLRHGSLPREDDGAIEFLRLKDYLRSHFVYSQQWSDEKWKSTMAKRRRQQEKISVLYRSFRRNSFTSELCKVIQDAISSILHDRTMF